LKSRRIFLLPAVTTFISIGKDSHNIATVADIKLAPQSGNKTHIRERKGKIPDIPALPGPTPADNLRRAALRPQNRGKDNRKDAKRGYAGTS